MSTHPVLFRESDTLIQLVIRGGGCVTPPEIQLPSQEQPFYPHRIVTSDISATPKNSTLIILGVPFRNPNILPYSHLNYDVWFSRGI